MTRERSDSYDDKKRLILTKAAALFAQKGFETTTMMDVAKACNASKSHLYHYFPAKEDLLYAIVKEHTEMLSQALPTEERFDRFVTTFVEIAADCRNEQLVLTNDLLKRLRRFKSEPRLSFSVGANTGDGAFAAGRGCLNLRPAGTGLAGRTGSRSRAR